MFKDIYRDGWGLVGLLAPIISIVASVLKLLDVDMQWLRELSWGWIFAPLAAWLLVAYVRRWRISQSIALANPHADTPMRDIFRYLILDSRWAAGRPENHGQIALDAMKEVSDAAHTDRVVAWGRRFLSYHSSFSLGSMTKIPADVFSNSHAIDWITVVLDDVNYGPSIVSHPTEDGGYCQVQMNRAQVRMVWPPSSMFQRWCDKNRKERNLVLTDTRMTSDGSG